MLCYGNVRKLIRSLILKSQHNDHLISTNVMPRQEDLQPKKIWLYKAIPGLVLTWTPFLQRVCRMSSKLNFSPYSWLVHPLVNGLEMNEWAVDVHVTVSKGGGIRGSGLESGSLNCLSLISYNHYLNKYLLITFYVLFTMLDGKGYSCEQENKTTLIGFMF